MSKKSSSKAATLLDTRSVLPVREHHKMAIYLPVAASAACAPKLASAANAQNWNAPGGFFNSPLKIYGIVTKSNKKREKGLENLATT
ncbi:MAG: hypothetical protein OEZ57_08015 [Nitrospirota bacterium]|nr:hypothetical protein [Nitrospirota bacterium]